MTEIKTICVYCGSQPGNDPVFIKAATEFGEALVKNGIDLVFGAGVNGIMGEVARSVRDRGGHVTGVIPEFLLQNEANSNPESICHDVLVTKNMHERKQMMFEHADAFVTLPGGIGTLEEIVEMMTWAQLGRHDKPLGFLDVKAFWKPLFELFDHMRNTGFIHTANRIKPIISEKPEILVNLLIEKARA